MTIEEACEILHSTYADSMREHSAQLPWAKVPEIVKGAMRDAVSELMRAMSYDDVSAHDMPPEVCYREFDKAGLPMHIIGDPDECPCMPARVTNEHGRTVKVIHHRMESHDGQATA
jgi:hypothetical protein